MAVETGERLLFSVEDAAASLGVSRRKVEYLIAEGQIAAVHVGRSVRVPTDSLRQYVERLTADQVPAGR